MCIYVYIRVFFGLENFRKKKKRPRPFVSLLDTYVYNRKQRKRGTPCNFYFLGSGG